ncbi:GNAT family N-acetyltransferase [Bacillus testis]|uniref:hypothetical protein n=1 Tax=Bacillus testis TaxID=1622072 RepID=UPI00067E7BE9|nr:hypothetical protein [Bacillus testis]
MKWGICEDRKEELIGFMDVFALDKKVNALTIGYLAAGKALGKGIAQGDWLCTLLPFHGSGGQPRPGRSSSGE